MKKINKLNPKILLLQGSVAFIFCFAWSFFRAASGRPSEEDLKINVDARQPVYLVDTIREYPGQLKFKYATYVEGTPFLGMDSAHVVESITSFLEWYRTNLNKANSFPFLGKDSDGYYRVDTGAVSGYLGLLGQSGFFSVSYLNIWKVFFNDQAEGLRREKMNEGVPEGFDMDFVLETQEPGSILDHIRELRWRMISMNRDVVLARCTSSADPSVEYEFEMYRNERSWLIGYISRPDWD
ncbi:MAG: hypothetical protein EOO09_04715 [Chitinophagaceae bacterium]|nr:MAG: hypothetical protein EOO09_04715 [Chitinophagaceae bacterium]